MKYFFYSLTVLSLLYSQHCLAQSVSPTVTLNGVDATVTVGEGDDFATDVLQNRWDFNQRRDIGWEENFVSTSVRVNSGIWEGVNETPGGYIFPLFGGFLGTVAAEGLHGDSALPRFGINHPIDTSKYTYLSFRLTHSSRSAIAVYWKSFVEGEEYWPNGTQLGTSHDGFENDYESILNSGFIVYSYDLTDLSNSFDVKAGSWTGKVVSLRIDPSTVGPAGTKTKLDWVRLVDPDSAPELTIGFSVAGTNDTNYATVWVDTTNSGFAGTPIKRFTYGVIPANFTIPTAMFPPGSYYFYVTIHNRDGDILSTSNYSKKLLIVKKPSVTFLSPTEITGNDYSTTEVGNSWDMSSSSDVPNLDTSVWPNEWRQFSNYSFTSGIFQASADVPLPGNAETDAQMHLNIPLSKPINTSEYRYLTYRLKIDGTNYTTISNKIQNGWVARPIFWNSNILTDAGEGKAHPIYEGWNTYTIDLWDEDILDSGFQWKSSNFKSGLYHLRIDPLETTIPTNFSFDFVKLTAENHTTDKKFTISWEIDNTDSTNLNVTLYRDDNNRGFNGHQIATFTNLSAGEHSYEWDTTGLSSDKAYYIYIVVDDGTNITKVYSPARIALHEGEGFDLEKLPSSWCSEWNGFLGLWNIKEYVNLSDLTRNVEATIYDINGDAQSTSAYSVLPGAQADALVHGFLGWTPNSYGIVCSKIIGGTTGDVDGRMVYYRPTASGYDFAFAMPFQPGLKGSQFATFNTFQPSLAPTDSNNIVTNWIQVTNLSKSSQTGKLIFYSQSGTPLATTSVILAAGARQDFPGHQFGTNLVGMIEWRPTNSDAEFIMRNNRYYYDNQFGFDSFSSAMQLEGTKGSGELITVPLDSTNMTAVLEVANVRSTTTIADVRMYNKDGVEVFKQDITLAPYSSTHLIADQLLSGGLGMATVKGNKIDSILAVGMHYGRTPSNGLKYVYGIIAKEPFGTFLNGSYNTFLNQKCQLLLTNISDQAVTSLITMKRFDGTTVLAGDPVSTPAKGITNYDLCSKELANNYGVVSIQSSKGDVVFPTVIRLGKNDDYRFPTAVR